MLLLEPYCIHGDPPPVLSTPGVFDTSVHDPGKVPPVVDFPAFWWGGGPAPPLLSAAAPSNATPVELGLFSIQGDQIGGAELSWDAKYQEGP